ncbi:MAG TPA: glycosyltransferase family 39 protein, partial [Terriglobales bacterium]|nr:glycosyltransferase family 39 protein [Terriglobales bacterium]
MQAEELAEQAALGHPQTAQGEPLLQANEAGNKGNQWLERATSPAFALPLLTLLCLGAFFVNLGGYPLYTKGEPREAVTVLDMFKGHSLSSFLLPMRAGVEIPSKPLLMHWLIAALSLLTGGLGEWTIRLPSAILATLGVLCCYLYTRRLFNAAAGLFAAIILATNFQYLQAAGGARVDMTLTFFMEVAFFEFLMMAEGLTARRMLLYLALAAAVLAKGPVGVVLPGAVAIVFIAVERRWSLPARLDPLKGGLVVAVLAGGWYAAATMIGGRAFIDKQILAENVYTYLNRAGMDPGHGHPFYYVELALLAGFLPWSLLLPFAAIGLAKTNEVRNPRARYLLIWLALVLLFYSFAEAKRGVYLLALYPALAALLGLWLAAELAQPGCPAWTRLLSVAMGWFFAAAGAGGLIAAALIRFWPAAAGRLFAAFDIKAPRFVPELSAATGAHTLLAVAVAALVIGLGWLLARTAPDAGKLAVCIAAGVACFSMVANLYVLPATANTIGLKAFAKQAARAIGDARAAYLLGLNYDVAFYSGM